MPLTTKQEEQLIEDVAAIKRAVIGEEATGHVGLVKRMTVMETWKDKMVIKIAVISGGLTVVVFLARYIITGKI